jgi:molecular chaperone GrpE
MHSYSPDVTEPTCVRILQPGYKVGDRILRPARVAVAEPGEPEPEESGGPADMGTGNQVNEGSGDEAQGSGHASNEAASGNGGVNGPQNGASHAGGID